MTARGTLRAAGTQLVADGFDDALDLWEALYTHFLARRPMRATWGPVYPETTVDDVQQAAGLLAEAARQLPEDALGRRDILGRWTTYRRAIGDRARGLRATDPYPDDEGFWRESRLVAVDVSAASPLPTKGDLVLDAVQGTMTGTAHERSALDTIGDVVGEGGHLVAAGAEKTVEVAGHVLDKGADVAKDLAKGGRDVLEGVVGGTVDAIVKPIFGRLTTPLLVGAAVVGGVLVVPKLVEKKPKGRAA